MPAVFGIGALIVLIDQTTKFLAVHYLKPIEQVQLIPNIFHLSYVENTGIAFGLFQNYPQIWSALISLSVILLVFGARFFVKESLTHKIAYGFILGGAVGNLIDRLRVHNVIDFLDFRIWPVFNVADSFICIGVAMFMWFAVRGR